MNNNYNLINYILEASYSNKNAKNIRKEIFKLNKDYAEEDNYTKRKQIKSKIQFLKNSLSLLSNE